MTARANQLSRWILAFGALLGLLTVACSAGFNGRIETRDDAFAMGDSPTIEVLGSHGFVTVRPNFEGMITVHSTLRDPDNVIYEISQVDDTIRVIADARGGGFFSIVESAGVDIEITAPTNSKVDIQTSNGRVEIYGMQRSGVLRTSHGRIVMDDVSGDFEVSTSHGAVTISRASGTFDVVTSHGGIEFDGELLPYGKNRMKTSNGSVRIGLRGVPSVELNASTSNGSVTSELPVATTSPDIKHHLMGTIGLGEAELIVRTSNGSVTIE